MNNAPRADLVTCTVHLCRPELEKPWSLESRVACVTKKDKWRKPCAGPEYISRISRLGGPGHLLYIHELYFSGTR